MVKATTLEKTVIVKLGLSEENLILPVWRETRPFQRWTNQSFLVQDSFHYLNGGCRWLVVVLVIEVALIGRIETTLTYWSPLFVNMFVWSDEFVRYVLINFILLLWCGYDLVFKPNMVMSINYCLSFINWMLFLYSLLFWLYFITFCTCENKIFVLKLLCQQQLYL